jgi:major membrane immunogen (membrane-anchored lipoprotein)
MLDMTGRWDIEWASALGTEHITLNITMQDGAIVGTATDDVGEYQLTDGRIDGDQASGAFRMTKPIPLTVTFTVRVKGDALTGKAKAGILPAAPVTGHRVAQ